jgi:hypothetical protein
MIAGLICGLFWFAAFLLGQLVVLRHAPVLVRPRATNLVLAGCLVGTAVSALAVCLLTDPSDLTRGGGGMAMIWGELTLVSLFVLYMPFYYTVAASLSIRTLVLLASTADGRKPIADVREQFVSRALVGQRLEIMRANGFLTESSGGSFTLTPKGQRLARIFAALKHFWRMDAGG